MESEHKSAEVRVETFTPAGGDSTTLEAAIPADVIVAQGEAADAAGKPITDVVFDFGNVFCVWDPRAALIGRYSPEAIEAFLDNAQSGFTDAIAITDHGGSVEEARAMIAARHGEKWARMYDWYASHFIDTMTASIPGALRLVSDLKDAGIGVWGLSNWGAADFPVAVKMFPVFGLLNDYIVSGYEKLVKPDSAIYELAIERFKINRTTSVFVDDRAVNIEGAATVGMRGIRFSGDMRALRRALVTAGLPIPAGDLPVGTAES